MIDVCCVIRGMLPCKYLYSEHGVILDGLVGGYLVYLVAVMYCIDTHISFWSKEFWAT